MHSSRIDAIDVARGAAALSVAIYHHGFGHALTTATGWKYFEFISWPGSTLAVPLFFVISGLCIHLGGMARPAEPGFTTRFLLQRFIRIYPAWLVAVGVSAIVLWTSTQSLPASLLLSHITLTNGFFDDYRLNAALWSVSVECCLYLLYPFWLGWRRRHGLRSATLLTGVVSATGCAVTAYLEPVPRGPALWFFLNVWCGWTAGAVLAELWSSPARARFNGAAWWWAGSLTAALHLGLIMQGFYHGAWTYLNLPITICLCVWPMSAILLTGEKIRAGTLSPLKKWVWGPLAAVGVFSYSLYLLHLPLQSLRFVLLRGLPGGPWLKSTVFVAWFALVLFAAWLCYRWVEAPALRLGRQWLSRRSTPRASLATIRP